MNPLHRTLECRSDISKADLKISYPNSYHDLQLRARCRKNWSFYRRKKHNHLWKNSHSVYRFTFNEHRSHETWPFGRAYRPWKSVSVSHSVYRFTSNEHRSHETWPFGRAYRPWKSVSVSLRNAGSRTKFAPVKSLDSSDSDSKIWDLKIFASNVKVNPVISWNGQNSFQRFFSELWRYLKF